MKICVISDSHGYQTNVERIVENKEYEYILFLGDGARDIEEIEDDRIIAVEGNCDRYTQYPLVSSIIINDKKIMFCHGHQFNVRQGLYSLLNEAINQKADIVCYGHTHIQDITQIGKKYFVNPGALCLGYALEIEISKNGDIKFNKIKLS